MSKTMLIDAAHAEEVRVCVLENGKVIKAKYAKPSKIGDLGVLGVLAVSFDRLDSCELWV